MYLVSFPFYLFTLFVFFSLPYVFLHKVVFLNINLYYLSKKKKNVSICATPITSMFLKYILTWEKWSFNEVILWADTNSGRQKTHSLFFPAPFFFCHSSMIFQLVKFSIQSIFIGILKCVFMISESQLKFQ